MNTLQFATNGTTYLFRYADGCEDQVVAQLMRLADDEAHELDWLDAATLGFQVVCGAPRRAREKAATKGLA
ncbi:MAG: hypothetical protein NTV86_14135 [Planctomycetota bacterium]|nr:hypothetical protein [Planctomycetota bacterium]